MGIDFDPALIPSGYSYSALSTYKKCSWEFYLGRILRLPKAGAVWLAGGNAFHAASEKIDLAAWIADGKVNTDVEMWQGVFDTEFDKELGKEQAKTPGIVLKTASKPSKAWPAGEDAAWWRQAGRKMVADYISWRSSNEDALVVATVKGGPAVELELKSTLGGVKVRGFLDLLMQDTSTGVYLLVDKKSGSRTVVDSYQPGQYSVQVGLEYGIDVTWGAFYNARKGGLGDTLDLTPFTPRTLGADYEQLDRKVRAGEFEPTVQKLCDWCDFKKYCKAFGGTIPAPKEVEVSV